jgi:hypothetical protein
MCCVPGWRQRPGSRWTTPARDIVVCTQIGNDTFAWFGATGSKSRLNFLALPRAGHTDYVVNEVALDYMREHVPAGELVEQLFVAGAPPSLPGRQLNPCNPVMHRG